jgi:hypothetical protein
MIKIYVCSNSKLEGVEGCVAQTIVKGVKGIRDGLAE